MIKDTFFKIPDWNFNNNYTIILIFTNYECID